MIKTQQASFWKVVKRLSKLSSQHIKRLKCSLTVIFYSAKLSWSKQYEKGKSSQSLMSTASWIFWSQFLWYYNNVAILPSNKAILKIQHPCFDKCKFCWNGIMLWRTIQHCFKGARWKITIVIFKLVLVFQNTCQELWDFFAFSIKTIIKNSTDLHYRSEQ